MFVVGGVEPLRVRVSLRGALGDGGEIRDEQRVVVLCRISGPSSRPTRGVDKGCIRIVSDK